MRRMFAEISSPKSSEDSWIDSLSNLHDSEVSVDEILSCLPAGVERNELRTMLAEYDDIHLASISLAYNDTTSRWRILELRTTQHEHVWNVATILEKRFGDKNVAIDRRLIDVVIEAEDEDLGLSDNDSIELESIVVENTVFRLKNLLGNETRISFATVSVIVQMLESEMIHEFVRYAEDL